jgi:hypothetical protein
LGLFAFPFTTQIQFLLSTLRVTSQYHFHQVILCLHVFPLFSLSKHISFHTKAVYDNTTSCNHLATRELQKNCDWCKPQSWVQLLHYHPTTSPSTISPPHTDSPLLTLAFPVQIGGLEVSWLGNGWIDIEKYCKANEVIVFGGSKLEALTKQAIYALPHRVISVPNIDRYSAPFKFDCEIKQN